jgi:prolyl-tRNA synthetase
MAEKLIEKNITSREKDYSQWYLDVVDAADLAEHSPVKGCMIMKPNGYALWEATQKILDEKFKEKDVQNVYFPLFIPERLLKREKEHIEGFAPEVAMVTHAGGKKLEEPLVVRPTSETIMYEVFSKWVRSYRDLPLLLNQWANVVRWEMRTRLFLRTTEFLWQEGHTVHESFEDADNRAKMMLEVYRDFAENYLSIPVIAGQKTESEKFAGALHTYSLEAMMQDGKALQFATSHNLGQNFAKSFDITFLDQNNIPQHAWQTSWGLSTRIIGALIMTHSDDKGLVLPPKIASLEAVIVPIAGASNEETAEINKKAEEIAGLLKKNGIKAKADFRDMRPGEKFYEWEKKGVPVRVELGPKDLKNSQAVLVRRDTGVKASVPIGNLSEEIKKLLALIQADLFSKAKAYQEAKTKEVDTWEDFLKAIEKGFVLAHFSGDRDIEAKIKEETGATVRVIPFAGKKEKGKCVYSGKPSEQRVIFAKAY